MARAFPLVVPAPAFDTDPDNRLDAAAKRDLCRDGRLWVYSGHHHPMGDIRLVARHARKAFGWARWRATALMVIWDIIVANIEVAWIVLTVPEFETETGVDRGPAGTARSPKRSRCWPVRSR